MKFKQMLPGQRLILISATNPAPQAAVPLTARSTNRRPRPPRAVSLLSAIVVLLCWYVGRPAISAIRIWPPDEWGPGVAWAWLRIGSVFLLFSIGTTAAILAARG